MAFAHGPLWNTDWPLKLLWKTVVRGADDVQQRTAVHSAIHFPHRRPMIQSIILQIPKAHADKHARVRMKTHEGIS